MLIGIISDIHDNVVNLLKAVKIFNERKVDLVIHCGDWVSPSTPNFCKELKCKIVSIFGNNEGDKYLFLTNKEKWNIDFHDKLVELELDGRKAVVYHGETKPILEALISSQKYDVVFSGHTHTAVVETKGKTLHVNPGSPCGVRGSELIKELTVAIYDTKSNKAEIISLE